MNWNRRKALPDWEKRRIRNRHKWYQRREQVLTVFLLLVIMGLGVFMTIFLATGGMQ